MKDIYNFIPLIVIITLYLYFRYQKNQIQFFTINNEPPSLQINKEKKILWLHSDINNIKLNTTNFTTSYSPSPKLYYTNTSINTELDYLIGFIIKPTANFKNIKVGFTNSKISDFVSKKINELDFGFNFIGNNKIQIIERNNPYIKDLSEKKCLTQNLDYCNQLNEEKCLNTPNTFVYQKHEYLGLLSIKIESNMYISENMILMVRCLGCCTNSPVKINLTIHYIPLFLIPPKKIK